MCVVTEFQLVDLIMKKEKTVTAICDVDGASSLAEFYQSLCRDIPEQVIQKFFHR